MPEAAAGLMVKYPEIGKVKTRLAETLGDEKASRIYMLLLENAMNMLKSLDRTLCRRTVFVTPPEFLAKYKTKFPGLDRYFPQKGNDLAERMRNALGELLSLADCKKAILIGADIPGLNKTVMGYAIQLLDEYDLVLGPTYDGGYYLIGLKRIQEPFFKGIEWGTSRVFKKTLEIAEKINVNVGLLPKLRDLDEAEDLKYFPDIIL